MGPRRWGRGRRQAARPGSRPSHASMGPRRWGRGRPDIPRVAAVSRRGFNGAATMGSRKTHGRRAGCRLDQQASMGPRRWGRGRRASGRRDPARRRLQWGRDDGVAEDISDRLISDRTRSASMGPRRWGRGRLGAELVDGTAHRCFNGAATMGSRKTCVWIEPAGSACFNGAATMGSRKTPHSSRALMIASVGFNGAATMGSRKTRQSRCSIAATVDASMGPRRWGRGRRADRRYRGPAVGASMGPRRWGRGRRADQVRYRCGRPASMGPRRWGRGRRGR